MSCTELIDHLSRIIEEQARVIKEQSELLLMHGIYDPAADLKEKTWEEGHGNSQSL